MNEEYQQGDLVWVKDPEYVWILGKISHVSYLELDYMKPSNTCLPYSFSPYNRTMDINLKSIQIMVSAILHIKIGPLI